MPLTRQLAWMEEIPTMNRFPSFFSISLRNVFVLALIVAALAVFAACGGSDDSTSPSDSPDDESDSRILSSSSPADSENEAKDEDRSSRGATSTPRSRSGALFGTPRPSDTPESTPTREPTATPGPTATPVPSESWVLTQANPMQRAAYQGSAADLEEFLNEGGDITAGAGIRNAALDAQWSGLTPLHLAAAFNPDLDVAKLLLEWGANLDQEASYGTPLHWAAAWNPDPAMIELLLEWGANLDYNDNGTPLHWAAQYNSEPTVTEKLIEWGANVTYDANGTPLHRAAANNPNPEIVTLLLENGAGIEIQSYFYYRFRDGYQNSSGTPLYAAVAGNPNPDVAALLLDRGADIQAGDSGNNSALHWAMWRAITDVAAAKEMTNLLLERGADLEQRGYNYWPPLFYASYYIGYEYGDSEAAAEMVNLLLDAGADPDAEHQDGSEWTTLHQAAYRDLEEVAEALLDGGADRKAEDSQGRTPCHLARDRGNFTGTPLLGLLCRP